MTPQNKSHTHRRRSSRLKGYDYSQAGAYFVTACTTNQECLFREILDGEMKLNRLDLIVQDCWTSFPDHFNNVEFDEYVVMPNHLHGIIIIYEVGATHASPLHAFGPKPGSLGAIVGSFKSAVSKRVNTIKQLPDGSIWQRNYHDHIIRDEDSLDRIRKYVRLNPIRWQDDREIPMANLVDFLE